MNEFGSRVGDSISTSLAGNHGKQNPNHRLAFLPIFFNLTACDTALVVQYRIEVRGDVTSSFEGTDIVILDTKRGRQIVIHKFGQGEDIQEIQISQPVDIQEREYVIYPNAPVTAAYQEDADNVSQIYDSNPMEKIILQRRGDTLQRTMDFTTQASWDEGSVQVADEFWDIPFPAQQTSQHIQNDSPDGNAGRNKDCGLTS